MDWMEQKNWEKIAILSMLYDGQTLTWSDIKARIEQNGNIPLGYCHINHLSRLVRQGLVSKTYQGSGRACHYKITHQGRISAEGESSLWRLLSEWQKRVDRRMEKIEDRVSRIYMRLPDPKEYERLNDLSQRFRQAVAELCLSFPELAKKLGFEVDGMPKHLESKREIKSEKSRKYYDRKKTLVS